MANTGGKRNRRRIASFAIGFVFIFSIAWQNSAVAQQTLAEKLLEIMRANHQITEEQYKQLKKEAEEEKATQAVAAQAAAEKATAAARDAAAQAAAVQVAVQKAETAEAKSAEAAKWLDIQHTGIAADNGEGGIVFNMKGIKVNVGGFIEAAGIYRSRSELNDVGSQFNAIPLSNNTRYFQDETRFSARQSRLSILAQGDYSPDVHLAGYYEMDFLGGAPTANSNESNSYNLRIRELYTTADWDTCGLHFLAGQNWSLVTQNTKGITPRNEEIPLTIDAQYVPGFNWSRQPQFRITKDWDKTFWLAFSVENPQTTLAALPNGPFSSGTTPGVNVAVNQSPGNLFGSNLSVNDIPDFVQKAAWECPWGHFEVFNLIRTFESSLIDQPGKTFVRNEEIVRDIVGGGFDIPIVPKQLNIQATAMYGADGRYGSGQIADVTEDSKGGLHPISAIHFLGGLTWQPCSPLQFYAYYGLENANREDLARGRVGFGYGSDFYDESVPTTINGAFGGLGKLTNNGQIQQVDQITVGDWYSFYQGKFGTLKLGLQYSYTQDHFFSGVNAVNGAGAATGRFINGVTVNDHMFFTSIRYYWN